MKKIIFAVAGIILVAVLGRVIWVYYQVKSIETKTPASSTVVATTTSVLGTQSNVPPSWKKVATDQFSVAFPDYPLYQENDMAGAPIIYPYTYTSSNILKTETYTVSPSGNSPEGVYSTYGYGLAVTTYVSTPTNPDNFIKELAKEQFSIQQVQQNEITSAKTTGVGSYREYDYSFQQSQGIDLESPQGAGLNMYGKGKIIIDGKSIYELSAFYQSGKKDTKKDTDLEIFTGSFVLKNKSDNVGLGSNVLLAQNNNSKLSLTKKISSNKFQISFPDYPLHEKAEMLGGAILRPAQEIKDTTTKSSTSDAFSYESYSFSPSIKSVVTYSDGHDSSQDSSFYKKYSLSIVNYKTDILATVVLMKSLASAGVISSALKYITYSNIIDSPVGHELSYVIRGPQDTRASTMNNTTKGKVVLFGGTTYVIRAMYSYTDSQKEATEDTAATNFINSFSLK